MSPIDINRGVDFERALARLKAAAGAAYRRYRFAKTSCDDLATDNARKAYEAALARAKGLRRTDAAEIAKVLADP